jgi:serine/threonine-protein kinase
MSGTPEDSRVGTQFGPYRLRRLIGAGGFGEVYEAEDTVKDRVVALKLLPEALSRDDVFRKRLQREAHAAGRLAEPHVVPIHDFGEIDGVLYVDMRLIDGVDLHCLLSDGPLTPARAVAIVRQVAAALDAAHRAGVMHRDVKPENVLITRDDFACLVDFGLATATSDERLTQMGTMVGTFSYMAPERFRNKEMTSSSDIYSLACVLHECLTGSRPYKADSLSSMITAHLTAPVPRPSQIRPGVPIGLDQVIARGMAKQPEDRFATAGDLASAAHDALTTTDKRRAASILERSEDATQPTGPGFAPPPTWSSGPPPPPTPPPTGTPGGASGRWPGSGAYGSGPQQVATPPPWTGPRPAAGSPSSRGSLTPWLIGGGLVALAAVVVAVVLLSTGILTSGGSGPSASTTTRVPPSGYTADDDKLVGLIGTGGYLRSTCTPQHPAKDGALSTLQCDALDRGPEGATFWLYGDQGALDDALKNVTSNATLQTCPDHTVSPGTWHYTKTPTAAAGQLACGTDSDGQANVMWTEDSKEFVALIRGSALPELFTWWQKKS